MVNGCGNGGRGTGWCGPDVWGRALDDRMTVTMPQPLGNASVSGRGVLGGPAVRQGIIGS